jgi:signal transduction histidine kinase
MNIPIGKKFIISFIFLVLVVLSFLLFFSNHLIKERIGEEATLNALQITKLIHQKYQYSSVKRENDFLKILYNNSHSIDRIKNNLQLYQKKNSIDVLELVSIQDKAKYKLASYNTLLEKAFTGSTINLTTIYKDKPVRAIIIPLKHNKSITNVLLSINDTEDLLNSFQESFSGFEGNVTIETMKDLKGDRSNPILTLTELNNRGYYQAYLGLNKTYTYCVIKPLTNNYNQNNPILVVRFNPLKSGSLKLEALKITFISLITAFIIMFIFVYRSQTNLKKSVEIINKGIKQAIEGNLNQKIAPVKEDICSPIADNLNELFSTMHHREYEIKSFQEELRSKKDNLEAIFNSSTDGIITLSSDLKIINVNPTITEWAGVSTEKIVGHHFNEFVKCVCHLRMSDIDCTDPSICPIAAYWPDEMPKEGIITNKSTAKTTFVGLNCSPIHGLTKSKESFVAVLMDITQFKELEKVKENFVATLTHDLRVPLLAESHTLKYFLKGTYGDLTEHQKLAAENMLKSNEDLLKLVNTLLDVYKYESGTSQLYKESVDLGELANACIQELMPLAEKNSQTIQNIIPANIPCISVDINEIKRVFMNLIGNAITYTQKNGEIVIEAEQNPVNMIIKITDNGKGIPENELKNIFDRYFTTAKKFRKVGTGLGLYLSKQIILAHNGKIWVESTPGKGTTFFFSLPIHTED